MWTAEFLTGDFFLKPEGAEKNFEHMCLCVTHRDGLKFVPRFFSDALSIHMS